MPVNTSQQYVFFGDSLTDNGNLYRISAGLIEDSYRNAVSGFEGRITNGLVYAEYPARVSGQPASLNYAIAGAEAVGTQTLRDFAQSSGARDALLVGLRDPVLDFDMNLTAQIDRFSKDSRDKDISDLDAFILIGGNDYGGIEITDPVNAISDIVERMFTTVNATLDAAWVISSLGVNSVRISGLPSAGLLPFSENVGRNALDDLDRLIDRHNALLQEGIDLLRLFGSDIAYFDLQAITEAIVDDASQFGIIAPSDLTLRDDGDALGGFDESQVGFWDSIHPSAATHAVLGGWLAYVEAARPLTPSHDMMRFGNGVDMVAAYGGDDIVRTSGGADLLFMGSGNDVARAGAGNDLVSAGRGDDLVRGGKGHDTLAVGFGSDSAIGGKGRDVLIDGAGDDLLLGRQHDDTFIFFESAFLGTTGIDDNAFAGGRGTDRLFLVLSKKSANAFQMAPTAEAGLEALGLSVTGIEQIDVVTSREDLSQVFDAEAWAERAELWGLL